MVLRVETGGGFVTPEYNLTQPPGFTLYGDGTVIVTGPMIEIFPQPAMPNLQTTTISQEAIGKILSAAKEAGLFANDVDYGQTGHHRRGHHHHHHQRRRQDLHLEHLRPGL